MQNITQSILADATHDSSHLEQTTFILRKHNFRAESKECTIEEHFSEYVDCNKKIEEDILVRIHEMKQRNREEMYRSEKLVL